MSDATFYNRTRQSENIRDRLVQRGEWLAVWLHDLLQKSYLGREGIANSGSYLFADHIYDNHARGDGWFGHVLDYGLLNLPMARSMRERCGWAAAKILATYNQGSANSFRLLTVPCGIPREVLRFVELAQQSSAPRRAIYYLGLDLDPAVVELTESLRPATGVKSWLTAIGDALAPRSFPSAMFNCATSTGLGEFLSDELLCVFYQNVFAALAPGGVFCTTNLCASPITVWLLDKFELNAYYRDAGSIERILRRLPWSNLEIDERRGQVYAVARK
jgi:hypothetical protein